MSKRKPNPAIRRIVAFSLTTGHEAMLHELCPEPRQRSQWLRSVIEAKHEQLRYDQMTTLRHSPIPNPRRKALSTLKGKP